MPKIVTEIEGRGNDIKINMINTVNITKSFARSASCTTEYFGGGLGSQSNLMRKLKLYTGDYDQYVQTCAELMKT